MKFTTAQQVYDFVRDRLLEQGRRSETNGDCAYRGEGGLRCAAGWLIADEYYRPYFEGVFVSSHSEEGDEIRAALRSCGIDGALVELVRDLQNVHDTYPPDTWRANLSELAHRWGLQP